MDTKDLISKEQSFTEDELKEMASQLAKPTGEKGLEIANWMNKTNSSMILETIKALNLQENDSVLELGPGNGNHLTDLHANAKGLAYTALDISPLMLEEARKFCVENQLIPNAEFIQYDGINIPLGHDLFYKIFTVNTIYFWSEPQKLLNELYKVLKPGGICCITMAEKESMDKMPVTAYGFKKYSDSDINALISSTSFFLKETLFFSETIVGKLGHPVERKYRIIILGK